MLLLCLGDVAFGDQPLASNIWSVPGGIAPTADTQVMFNWEFPTGEKLNSQARESGSRYRARPDSIETIKNWAPGIATLATNHVLDAGEEGLAQTIDLLQQKGFKTVGAGMTVDEIGCPLVWETAQGKLSIINWVFAETHPDWAAVPGPNCWPGFIEAGRNLRACRRNSDWTLVVVHWSDELFSFPRPADREIARALAGMGADIVIGHHPHVVRGMEVIGNCPVFYSLGNFYFAETSSVDGEKVYEAPRNREGLGIKLIFQKGQAPKYELLSFWNNNHEARRDPFQRASRRLISTSRPVRKYRGDAYLAWYKKSRAIFDKWTIRWQFGLRQRGVIGTLKKVAQRRFKLPLLSGKYNP